MSEISYSCPTCLCAFTAPEKQAGQSFRCWACGKDIQIPTRATATEPPKPKPIQSKPAQPQTPHIKSAPPSAAKGVLRAGWICFGLGMILLIFCLLIPFYSPLFLASFILSIIAISQRRHRAGLTLLFSTIFIPAITAAMIWIFIIGAATTEIRKGITLNPQPILMPQHISNTQLTRPAKPVAPSPHKMVKTSPSSKPIIRRSTIPNQTVSLENLLSLLEQKAHGFQTADTSLDRDEVIQNIQKRTTKALSDYALQFTATITDVRMKSDGICRVSFKDLNDGGLSMNKKTHLRIIPTSSINVKMAKETARNIHPGQKITVRAKAKLSTGILHSSNFLFDIWVKSPFQKVGSLSILENTIIIRN